jgi:hypothetical protein
MKEWFFLDGICSGGTELVVIEGIENSANILSDMASAEAPFSNQAPPVA